MTITKILGNYKELPEKIEQHIEKFYVSNEELAKRIHHGKSDHNTEIHVRLQPKEHLHVGDILYQDEQRIVVVEVLNEDVLTIFPASIQEMGVIAHALGNRHLPAQFSEDTMLVQYDYLVEKLLREMKLEFKREERYLNQPFRHLGHSHD